MADDELQRVGLKGAFLVYSEQEASGWIKGTLEAARTSVRLGYGIESPQLNRGLRSRAQVHQWRLNGDRIAPTGALKLEGAWVPEGTSLEIYGEYAPALSTKANNNGITARSKMGTFDPPNQLEQPNI